MKVVILCGGKGTRLHEETEFRPKPMVEIGGQPILWHIMQTYSFCGFRDFILCLGYKGEVIRRYFYDYAMYKCNFTVNMRTGECEFHGQNEVPNWRVTLVDTGKETLTGGRVKKIENFIDEELFLLTYGDGLTDLDIRDTLSFHRSHGKIGTVTGVSPPSRYGELYIEGDRVLSFREKPQVTSDSINGGYFVFSRRFFDYLEDRDDCMLERAPLERLADDGKLQVYHHYGFWQCMDTFRDYKFLTELWKSGKAPWKVLDKLSHNE